MAEDAKTVSLNLRVSSAFADELEDRKKRTGVPTAEFLRRCAEEVLKREREEREAKEGKHN